MNQNKENRYDGCWEPRFSCPIPTAIFIPKARFLYVSSTDGGIDDDTIEIYNITNPTAPVR
ncbi:hypothetical protein V7117_27220, partial [Bacillus pseudomycoides]